MKKNEYLKLAIIDGLYKQLSWVISIVAVTNETETEVSNNRYPYRIVQTPTGVFYLDPSDTSKMVKIDDAKAGSPLFAYKEAVNVDPSMCLNLSEPVISTLGILLVNLVSLAGPFGNKIPYINSSISVSKLEQIIAPKLRSLPKGSEKRDDSFIYVDEYLKFMDSLSYLEGLSQTSVWSATVKTMSPPPGVKELRDKLVAEHKDSLHDPATIALIEGKLQELDSAFLADDPGGTTFASGKKMRTVVRKKLYLTFGAEAGIEEGVAIDPIFKSLSEGWDVKDFPQLNNNLRAGSFSRGSQTQLGGLLFKELLRASSNIRLETEDCGTKLGIPRLVTELTYKKLVGISVIEKGTSILITNEEQAKTYIGKVVIKRSPMYCKMTSTDFCRRCIGTSLSESPTGLSLAISDYGSAILTLFLKKMHGSALAVSKMDIKTALS